MTEKKTKFCQHCGKKVAHEAEICPKCGVRVKQESVHSEKKSEGIAAVLSFIIPGLGQIYNGQIGRGILFIILAIIFAVMIIVLIGLILYPLFWIWTIYDAYKTAKRINTGEMKV